MTDIYDVISWLKEREAEIAKEVAEHTEIRDEAQKDLDAANYIINERYLEQQDIQAVLKMLQDQGKVSHDGRHTAVGSPINTFVKTTDKMQKIFDSIRSPFTDPSFGFGKASND